MSLATYADFKTFLGTFSHRSDTSSVITDIVTLTEDMVYSRVRAIELITSDTVAEADRSSGAVYNLPSDFLEMRALYGTYNSIEYAVQIVSLNELRSYSASVPPYFASTYGTLLEFRGTPDTDSSFDIVYYARPAVFSSAVPTLFTTHPNLYIHAGLYFVYLYAQDMEVAKAHMDLFDSEVEAINKLAARARAGGRNQPTANLMNNNRSSM